MSDDINYKNNPLHGLSLKNLLIEIVDHYGFEILYAYLNINCFKMNQSIASSVKFLKKTEWAREKIESFYLYQYKNLPRASEEQFALAPRDRIIPDDQTPGEPMVLSLEDAERLREKKAKRAAERKQSRGRHQRDKIYGERTQGSYPFSPKERDERSGHQKGSRHDESPDSPEVSDSTSQPRDPWSEWR